MESSMRKNTRYAVLGFVMAAAFLNPWAVKTPAAAVNDESATAVECDVVAGHPGHASETNQIAEPGMAQANLEEAVKIEDADDEALAQLGNARKAVVDGHHQAGEPKHADDGAMQIANSEEQIAPAMIAAYTESKLAKIGYVAAAGRYAEQVAAAKSANRATATGDDDAAPAPPAATQEELAEALKIAGATAALDDWANASLAETTRIAAAA